MRVKVALLCVLFSGVCGAFPEGLETGLEYGPYTVGFRSYYAVDASRTVCPQTNRECGVVGRPLRIFVWYPGQQDSPAMTFDGFLGPSDPNSDYSEFNDLQRNRIQRAFTGQFFSEPEALKAAHMESLKGTSTCSILDARPAQGAFPLILHGLGLGSHQIESTVLWEYLASHGYIVAVPGQLGPHLEQARVQMLGDHIRLIAQDFLFVEQWLRKRHLPMDQDKVGYTGHSFGSLPALLAAATRPLPVPIVMLDGSANNQGGVKAFRETGIAAQDRPLKILNLMSTSRNDLDDSLFQGLSRASISTWRIHDASHFDFQNWGLYMARFGDRHSPALRRRSVTRGRDIGVSSVRLTRDFFDWTLKGESSALRRIEAGYSLPSGTTQFQHRGPSEAGSLRPQAGLCEPARDPRDLICGRRVPAR